MIRLYHFGEYVLLKIKMQVKNRAFCIPAIALLDLKLLNSKAFIEFNCKKL